MFNKLATANDPQTLYTLGVPGLVFIIIVLAGIVVVQYKTARADNKDKQDRIDAGYEQRITDAKETRDKITEPLEKQAAMSDKIYDLLLTLANNRRR